MERKHIESSNNNYISNFWIRFFSTPLHYAAAFDHLNIVMKLIEYNADIGIEDDEGYSAYDYAVFHDSTDVADYLASL